VTSRRPARLLAVGSLAWAVGVVLICNACQAFVNRRAILSARVVTSDGQAGVPCTVTALLFGQEEASAQVLAGADAILTIGMMTPAKVQSPVKANVALRVACQGYSSTTTGERETEVTALDPPKLEFGTISVARAKKSTTEVEPQNDRMQRAAHR
jgi:hypothetical protein